MKSVVAPLALVAVALPAFSQSIVINEIMYHPSSENPAEEYIELHNRGPSPVNLAGWRFANGVEFTLPGNSLTTLAPGGYLVVAANAAAFQARYPGVANVVGDWVGQLSNGGETIELQNAQGDTEDTVRYADAGEWGTRERGPLDLGSRGWTWSALHDGGGSSLELLNPALPNNSGQNWAASRLANGTPGAANSTATNNVAPFILSPGHFPPVPKSTDTVTITARIEDESTAGVTATLFFRNASTTNPPAFTSLAMFDDGAHGDGAAADGVFGALVPAQTNGTVIEFYLEASDGTRTRKWPALAADEAGAPVNAANALYQVDDSFYAGPQPILRLVFTETERRELQGINRQSDAQMNATLVSIDGTETLIRHRVGVRIRGAGSRSAAVPNYRVNIPSDQPWNGLTAINLNSQYIHSQIVGSVIAQKAGLLAANARVTQVRVNGQNLARAAAPGGGNGSGFGSYLLVEPFNNEWAGNHIPLDPNGNVYRASSGPHLADLGYLGTNPDNYILAGYSKTSNGSENDWSDLINLVEVLDTERTPDEQYAAAVRARLNVEQWMTYFAVFTLTASGETSLGTGEGDDYGLYRGILDTRFKLLGHDFDTILGQGDTSVSVNRSIFVAADVDQPAVDRFLKWPDFVPLYYEALLRLANSAFSSAQVNPILDQHLSGFVPPNIINAMKTFNTNRLLGVLAQIPQTIRITNTLSLQSGFPRTTDGTISLSGSANAVTTRSVFVNGAPATWVPWQATWTIDALTLQPGINRVLVQSLDGNGREADRATIDIWYDNGSTTTISESLESDSNWTPENGPFLVSGTVNVPSGVGLTIQPGTTVYFAPGASLVFSGTGSLRAVGSDAQRIRFTRQPGVAGNWVGLVFNNTTVESRISYADIEYAGGPGGAGQSLRAVNALVQFDHINFANTTAQYISVDNSSFVIRQCVFPSLVGRELIHGDGLQPRGQGIIQSNIFGTTTGLNDIIDFTGGQRTNAILQVLDNVFLGASDDHLDLDGTDAHIEGNIFMGAHQQTPGGDTSSAIAGGRNGADTSELTIVRNLFFDCDHAVLAKEGNFYTLENNTMLRMGISAVNFGEPLRGVTGGAGAILDGNIIWDTPLLFENFTNGVMNVTVTRSILPTNFPGAGNLVADPLFVSTSLSTNLTVASATALREALRLRLGSPAMGTGPNGLDMGALVPAGVSISGEPPARTSSRDATLTVGGPGIVSYRFRVNNTAFSADRAINVPIVLTNLANNTYRVTVQGRNDAGVLTTFTLSRSWVVNSESGGVRLNEVLARNESAVAHEGAFPDLVELFNTSGSDADLSGWGLTDDTLNPFQFQFPANTTLPAGQYLTLYADSRFGASGLHLGFGLNQAGDTLYLVRPDGSTADSVRFGGQVADLSIGRDRNDSWVLSQPTFGAANVAVPLADPHRLKINEWLANGRTIFSDDFIELYNPEPRPVALGGHYLTDNPLGWTNQHEVALLTFIPARGHFVFLADGNTQNGAEHLNFRLSPDQGAIGLFDASLGLIDCVYYGPQATDSSQGRRPDGADLIAVFGNATQLQPTPGAPNPGLAGVPMVTTTTFNLMPMLSTWRYFRGTNRDTAWIAAGFNDSSWSQGPALLGEEDSTLAFPLLTRFENYTRSQITYYFRTRFTLSSNVAGFNITGTTMLDDGAVIYLNGTELTRIRLAPGPVTFSTLTTASVEATPETFTFPASRLRQGVNVIAVEVHQSSANSSDIVWGMALDATRSVTNVPALPLTLNEVLANNSSIQNPDDGSVTDWVEVYNATSTDASLEGLSLSDDAMRPRRWVFPPGTTLAPGARMTVKFDGASPASTTFGPALNTGFGLAASGDQVYLFDSPARGGALLDSVAFGVQLADHSIGRPTDGAGAWTLCLPTPGAANIPIGLGDPTTLRLNEWLANPAGNNDDFFELYNPNAQPVALGGLFLTDDLLVRNRYRIPDLSFIGAGEDGFLEFIADGKTDRGADHVNFSLERDGESLGLFTANGTAIDTINFGPQDNDISEGRFPDGSTNIVRFRGTASPGQANALPLANVVISEALTHTDPPLEDAIELHNPSATAVDLSGWFLTDRRTDPKRFRIPAGTILPPGGFVVFYEYQFNPNFDGRPPAFALDSVDGDQVYLFTADAAGNLTGFRAGVDFGAAENGVSFGRFATSTGYDFTALNMRTFGVDNPSSLAQFRTGTGAANATAKVGPVVINEIMYHPPDLGTNDNVADEFIELRNVSGAPVPLFDPSFPTNTWRLRDAVTFRFPQNVTLPTDGYALVVSFNPATNAAAVGNFRARYGLAAGVPLYGPYNGQLANDSDSVELVRPDAPQPLMAQQPGFVPQILVDRVRYRDSAPWPVDADRGTNGAGTSLQRRISTLYGNDAVNWFAGSPTPNAANGSPTATLPDITSFTPSHAVALGANDTLTVTAIGAGPLRYEWRFNGRQIDGATNASFTINNFQLANVGDYSVIALNSSGAAAARARLDVSSVPIIVRHPVEQSLITGDTATFSVIVAGSAPFTYQWRRDGVDVPGATGPVLVIPNAQPGDQGNFTVVIANNFGSVTSRVAALTLNAVPMITLEPQSTNVLVGSAITLRVEATGASPLRYQWRFNGNPIPGATNASYVIPSAQAVHAGNYRVLVTNALGSVLSSAAILNVLPPPTITVRATDPIAGEAGLNAGAFTITRAGLTNLALTANFIVSGTATADADYRALGVTVSFAANEVTRLLRVVVLDDRTPERTETVVLTLTNGVNYLVGAANTATVSIADDDNQLPRVVIVSPADGGLVLAGNEVLITATATDADGSVVKVEFFENGTNRLGEAFAAPFTALLPNATPGPHVLTAVATDDLGAQTTSAPVTVFANGAPVVTLTSPANGARVVAGTNLTLSATATDPDGVIVSVEFYRGGELIEADTTRPFSVVWNSVPAGSHVLTARAVDDRGTVTISTPVLLTATAPAPTFTDAFDARHSILDYNTTAVGNNVTYTREAGEPRHANRNGAKSGWLSWTAPGTGLCRIDTFGSSFDTVLAVYIGNALNTLSLVVSNDDADDFTVQSAVTFDAQAGQAYEIAVDGRSANISGSITMHLNLPNPNPVVTTHPVSQIATQGATVRFTVTATGTPPLSYQWQRNGIDVGGGGNATLTLNNITVAHEGQYACVVRNALGETISASASLTVFAPPTITVQPRPQTVDPGGTATFSVVASGSGPITYQWRLNGVVVPGANGSTYTLLNVQPASAGTVSVSAANSFGTTLSQSAELLVRPRWMSPQRMPDGSLRLTLVGTPGRRYAIDSAPTLSSTGATWTPLISLPAAATPVTVTETNIIANPQRFYRLRLMP